MNIGEYNIQFELYCANVNDFYKIKIKDFEVTKQIIFVGNTVDFITQKSKLFLMLSEYEVKRLQRFIFEGDKDTYCISHALLRHKLSKILNIAPSEIDIDFYSTNSKPRLQNFPLDFNLSHSKNYFAFAIAEDNNTLIGVDIEKIDFFKDFDSIAQNYMHEQEKNYITDNSCSIKTQLLRFYEIWTRKESFLKMIGTGIILNLTEINVSAGKNEIVLEHSEVYNLNYRKIFLFTYVTNEYVISIASCKPEAPNIIELSADNI